MPLSSQLSPESDWWAFARDRAFQGPEQFHLSRYRFLLRLGLIASIESKRWFKIADSYEYLEQIYSIQRVEVSQYDLHQQLSILFSSGLSMPSGLARAKVKHLVGEVPFLGKGIFDIQEADLQIATQDLESAFWLEGGMKLAKCSYSSLDQWPFLTELRADLESLKGSDQWNLANFQERISTTKLPFLRREDEKLEARFRLATIALNALGANQVWPLPDFQQIRFPNSPFPEPFVEGSKLEFKASFEWNIRTRQKSGDLRFGVLKTICGFLNSDGGQLVIGVQDDGAVIGLMHEIGPDLSSKAKDTFEGKVREAIKNFLRPFPHGLVRIEFHELQGQEVCLVDILPSKLPVFMSQISSKQELDAALFLRDGNRTISLSGEMREEFLKSKRG